jgi:GNAT superfamily N-acetyltransferase
VITISQVDTADDSALRSFWEVLTAATNADRPSAPVWTWGTVCNHARVPTDYASRAWLGAYAEGEMVGCAMMYLPTQDNTHLADVEIAVLPAYRRQGIGRLLYEAVEARARAERRTTLIGEAWEDGQGDAGLAFATSLGFRSVHTEVRLTLDLPVEAGRVEELRTAAGSDADYEIVTWGDYCPDEYLAAYCRMLTQMEQNVPRGEIDLAPITVDEARVRSGEAKRAKSQHGIVAAARRVADGELGGYSALFTPHDADYVLQSDTLVMPDHRGRRLGLRLKLGTLDAVQRDHPGKVGIHTWTDPANGPMIRTNTAFGFRRVDTMHEVQQTLG